MNIPARQFELAKKHDEPLAVVAPPSDASSLMAVISRAASDPQTDVTKLERLLGMYERIKSTDAEQAFNQAMNDAQKAMHRIAADANNPQTKSRYASYAALDRILRPIYTAHGFSLSFDTGEAPDNFVKVVCYVSHAQGHTRTYHIDMPADGKGAKGGDVMTKTHATGAAATYGQRYLLKMIFNVAVGSDDDGNGASGESISEAQRDNILFLIAETGADVERFCRFMGVEAVPDIKTKDYDRAVRELERKGRRK